LLAEAAAGKTDARETTSRETRACDRPALAAVRGLEDDLAAVVDRLRVERVDRERRRPVTAVFEIVRRRVQRVDPRSDGAGALGLGIPPCDGRAVARRPNDIRVLDVGYG